MKRFEYIFKGTVQGVGFRWTLSSLVHKYNISGFCENLDNGDVLAQLEGKQDDINAVINELFMNQRYIHIDDYSVKEKEPEGSYSFNCY